MYKGKKEKKDNVKEGTWEGVAEKRTDGLSRQLMVLRNENSKNSDGEERGVRV